MSALLLYNTADIDGGINFHTLGAHPWQLLLSLVRYDMSHHVSNLVEGT